MKEKNYAGLFALFTLLILSTMGNAQPFNEIDEVPHDISYYRESRITSPLVKVLYGRPSKENKEIFGKLVPFGQVWRTGYNEATEVKFYKDVQFGDIKVAAGSYVLITIPGEEEWKVILNSQLDTWGAFQYNPLFNIAEITVPSCRAEALETFSITFKKVSEKIQMVLGWDTTRVKIPLHFQSTYSQLAHRLER